MTTHPTKRYAIALVFILILLFLGCAEKVGYQVEDDISIDIVQPIQGETIEGTITIKAVIGSSINIQKLVLLLDGEEFAASTTAEWKTTFYPDGEHVVSALIIDAEGNEIYAEEVVVTVANSPDLNQNVILDPDFESYQIEWDFNNIYIPINEWHNDTYFVRLYLFDSFLSQSMQTHFEEGQKFRLRFYYKAQRRENSNNTIWLGYREFSGRRHSLMYKVDVKMDWQLFEFDIDPPLAAGEFTELRIESDHIDLDDVELIRIE